MNEHAKPHSDAREKILLAEGEEAAGRPWRAKEILGGCVGNLRYGTNHELLAAYGALLDRLGDHYQAGKYLFLSGSEHPDHQDAIRLYLDRNKNVAPNDFVAQFPGVIRHQGLGTLPAAVRSKLESWGIATSELQRTEPQKDVAHPGSLKDNILMFLLLGVLAASVILWGIGLITCVSWVWSFVD